MTLSRGAFSASSLVTTVPVTAYRIACFPFVTVTFFTAASPAHRLVRTASQTGQRPWQERLRAVDNQAEKSPRCADQEARRKTPGTAENQAETGGLAGPPNWLAGGSL